MTDNPSLKAALEYAKSGFEVFPLRSKRPITPSGFHDASSSVDMVKAWWGEHPEYGVGIRIPDWAVVVDLDSAGAKALKAFGHDLPATVTARTKRGSHHWYELPPGVEASRLSRCIHHLPDVDVLINGYVVAPPSAHPQGGNYAWEEDSPPLSRSACETAPEWVVVALAEENSHERGFSDDEFMDGLTVGQRQIGLFRRACRLRHLGNTTGEAKAILRDLAERSGSGDYDTSGLVDRVWRTYDDDAARAHATSEIRVWSLSELLHDVQEQPDYLIDKLLPGVGYTILFAPQGAGKSVLADQAALAIATGGTFLGRKTRQTGVLVLDVEQDPASSAERWRRLLCGTGMVEAPANLYTAFEWPVVGAGGFEKLGAHLVDHPHIGLVICDTLGAFWPDGEAGSDPYNRDRKVMQKFVSFAREYGIAFLLVHHSRKSQAGVMDDFSDMASGTRGITGPAKARWGLQRKSFEATGKLMFGGKIPEGEMEIVFDGENLMWR